MRRTITVQESESKALPAGMRWRTIGAARHPDYMVRYDRGNLETGHSNYVSLTEARKAARSIVREGRAWAEVFRFAENGAAIKAVHMASYEVSWEAGAEVL